MLSVLNVKMSSMLQQHTLLTRLAAAPVILSLLWLLRHRRCLLLQSHKSLVPKAFCWSLVKRRRNRTEHLNNVMRGYDARAICDRWVHRHGPLTALSTDAKDPGLDLQTTHLLILVVGEEMPKPLHARDPPTTEGLIEPHGHWRDVVMFVHTEKQKAKGIHCSSVLCEIISPYTSQKHLINPDLEGRIPRSLTNYDDFLHLCAGRGSDNQFEVCFWFKTQDAHETL